jgi:hypothetical protein
VVGKWDKKVGKIDTLFYSVILIQSAFRLSFDYMCLIT